MLLLFPCHPLKPRLPDPAYESEVYAAQDAGFKCNFYNLELLRDGDAAGACASMHPAPDEGTPILHRGWMMSDTLYSQLHTELQWKQYAALVSPSEYSEAHYLPNWYSNLVEVTPESVWMNGSD